MNTFTLSLLFIMGFLTVGKTTQILEQGMVALLNQRSLDRCLQRIMTTRCTQLTRMARINKLLRIAEKQAMLARSLRIIPALSPQAQAAEKAAITLAVGLVRTQDLISRTDHLYQLQLLSCGHPTLLTSLPLGSDSLGSSTSRPLPRLHPQIPRPLQWNRQHPNGIRFWITHGSGQESFGSCVAPQSALSSRTLEGEKYGLSWHVPEGVRLSGRPQRLSVSALFFSP